MSLLDLFEQHTFDPSKPGQMLIVKHRDSTDEYEIGPIVIVTDETGYRVSQAVFSSGEMKPGQSVTFDRNGVAIHATTVFGSQAEDLELSVKLMDEKIEAYYLDTEAEYHNP